MLRNFRYMLVAAALAATTGAAHAEVIEKNDRGFVTRDTAEVTVDLRATWLALISPGKWWNSSHTWSGDSANMTLTPQAGGCFCERLPGEDSPAKIALSGGVEHMTVILALPDQVLRMRGGLGPLQSEPADGVLTVTLRATDAGTRILWEYAVGGFHRFDQDMIANAVDSVMSEQLLGLANHLGPVAEPEADDTGRSASEIDAEEAGEAIEDAADESAEATGEAPEDPGEARASVEEAFDDLN